MKVLFSLIFTPWRLFVYGPRFRKIGIIGSDSEVSKFVNYFGCELGVWEIYFMNRFM